MYDFFKNKICLKDKRIIFIQRFVLFAVIRRKTKTQLQDFRYTTSKRMKFAVVQRVWNVMAHAQKPDFVFRRNGRIHLNRRGRQFSRLLAAELCASALVMLDTPRSEVVWEYWLPTPFASFPFTSPTLASPCAIRFQTRYINPSFGHFGPLALFKCAVQPYAGTLT